MTVPAPVPTARREPTPRRDPTVERMLHTVLMPGFQGTAETLPDWLHRALDAGLGGVTYFTPNLSRGAEPLSARLHAAHPRLLIASDEEGGPVTRLDAAHGSPYPGNAALGRVDDPATTERVARAIGADLRSAGIDVDFAPPVDINVNPRNPVIGVRAFGARAEVVSRHGAAFVAGLRAAGVAATAKHFPGHGDTHVDSHHALPVIDRSPTQLAERELVPFHAAVRAGARLVMPGHIRIPALGSAPASVNPRAYALLRGELGFDGVAVTDALDMRALAHHFTGSGASPAPRDIATAAVAALRAGADLLCLGNPATLAPGQDAAVLSAVLDALREAVHADEIPHTRLAAAAARVTALAAWSERVRATTRPGPGDDRHRLGVATARRALCTHGTVTRLTEPTWVVLVDVRHGTSPVADSPQSWLADALRHRGHEVASADGASPMDAPVVILASDPDTPEARAARAEYARRDPVLVVTGWPRHTEHPHVVWTYGNSAASAQAAAEALCGRDPDEAT